LTYLTKLAPQLRTCVLHKQHKRFMGTVTSGNFITVQTNHEEKAVKDARFSLAVHFIWFFSANP